MRREIRESRAIVTGASSGIGRAVVQELVLQGAHVIATARRADRLETLVEELRGAGPRVLTIAGDITDPAIRRQTVEMAQRELGGLDILVNNAGAGAMGLFADSSLERARRLMELNYFALVDMIHLGLPLLQKGRQPIVVNVSSILGRRGVPFSSEYAATKFAVHGLSESIRAEFHKQGIDVLVVSPGTTETEFFDVVIERTGQPAWPEHKPVSAAHVAQKTVAAIRKGKHEIVPYGLGKILLWLNRLSPRLVDSIMTRYV